MTGVADNAVAIALANGASVTDDITPGQSVVIPDGLTTDVQVTGFFAAYQHPATAAQLLPEGAIAEYGVIGDMTIGINFIIA